MKTKRFLAILMTIVVSMTFLTMPSSATEVEETQSHITIIFEDENLSDEFKERATAYFLNGEENNDNSSTYGIICQLNGHKLENTTVTSIEHKVRSTAPRCLEKIYLYEACSRCSYESSTLKSSSYIYCCS